MSVKKKKKVRDHFQNASKNRVYKIEAEAHSGMMVWDIRKYLFLYHEIVKFY